MVPYHLRGLIGLMLASLVVCGCRGPAKPTTYTATGTFGENDDVPVRTVKGNSVSPWRQVFTGWMIEQNMILFARDPSDETLSETGQSRPGDAEPIGRFMFQNRARRPVFVAGQCVKDNVVSVRAYSIEIYRSDKWVTLYRSNDGTTPHDLRVDPAEEIVLSVDLSSLKSVKRPAFARIEYCGLYSQPFLIDR
jgi:hypothetical protein